MSVKITSQGIDTLADNIVNMDKFANAQIGWDDLNPGSCLQIKFANSNSDWGSIGVSTPVDRPEVDVALTTRGNNSTFIVYGQISTDDTNSNTYGCGCGLKVSSNGGATWTDIAYSASHENYMAGAYDTYMVARHAMHIGLSYPKGTNLIFRLTVRFHSSNGKRFMGNGSTATTPYYGIRQIVQEIKT